MLQASQCPHLTWKVSTLMTSMQSRRATALRPWLLQVASVAGRLLIFSRTSVTFSTARVQRSIFAVTKPFCLIAHLLRPSPCRRTTGRRSVNPRGCSLLSTLFLTTLVYPFRRTSARSEHAVAQRPLSPSVLKDRACGKASSRLRPLTNPTLKDPKVGNEEEMARPTDAFAYSHHTPHPTHPCIFPSHNPPSPMCSSRERPKRLSTDLLQLKLVITILVAFSFFPANSSSAHKVLGKPRLDRVCFCFVRIYLGAWRCIAYGIKPAESGKESQVVATGSRRACRDCTFITLRARRSEEEESRLVKHV